MFCHNRAVNGTYMLYFTSILYRRAVRLRRLTGNKDLRSQGEIDAKNMTVGDLAVVLLVRPFVLGFREPIVFCWNAYLSLLYGEFLYHSHIPVSDEPIAGILYCWIESFSVVFIEKHHFNLGQNGLAFIVSTFKLFICLVV